MIGMSSPGKLFLLEQFAHLQLDQLQSSSSSIMSTLFRKTTIAGTSTWRAEQDVLARLRHRAVGRRDHQDRAIHLGRAGDHVLDVVGVPGAVHVGVVPLLGLVLDVGDGDGDAPLALLGRVVDLVKGRVLGLPARSPAPW